MSISKFLIRRLQALFVLAASMLMCLHASAYSFSQDGIYYNITSSTDQTVEVTYQSYTSGGRYSSAYYTSGYSGIVTIPSAVTYGEKTYKVTSIGNHAFDDADVTEVNLPTSVIAIGDYAFNYCSKLSTLNIPNVINIGNYAFNKCSNLISVTLPTSLTNIGDNAFSWCYSLASVEIPSSVTAIGNNAFYHCSELTSVNIPALVTTIGNSAFSFCSKLTSVSIPASVTTISSSIFSYCSSLTSVDIPTSVTTIGSSAFSGCTSLTSIEIPSSVTTIGSSAFSGCLGLVSIKIPSSVTTIAGSTFSGCSSLTSVEMPSTVTEIGNCAFQSCSGLITISIPPTVTTIGNYAFEHCKNLSSVFIPVSVTSIGYSAFEDCSSLSKAEFASIESLCTIHFDGDYANPLYTAKHLYINGVEPTSIVIPSTVTSISRYTFAGCTYIKEVTIESDAVMSQDFNNWFNLKTIFGDQVEKITIGDEVNHIANYAFYGCSNILSIKLPSSVESIGAFAFYNCSGLTSIPTVVTEIGESAFAGCSGLTSVSIPSSMNSLGAKAFTNCAGLKTVTINSDMVMNQDINAVSNMKSFFGAQVEEYIIGNGVTKIPGYIFRDCTSLNSVSISSSVKSIGYNTFDGCSNLTKAEFTSIESLCDINFSDNYANPLYYAKHLYIDGVEQTNVVIPTSVHSIGDNAFRGYNGSISFATPSSIESIGNSAFSGCKGLTELPNLSSLTSIGEWAFGYCSGLTSIVLPSSLVSLGEYAFYYCSALKDVTIESNTLMNKNYSSEYKFKTIFGEQVENYIIGDKVKQIPNYAFSGCEAMTSVTLPSSLNSIGDYAFYSCSGLTSITIPSSVNSIGKYAFADCNSLTSINIPASVTSIDNYAFVWCNNLVKAEFASIEKLCSIRFEDSYSNPLNSAHHLYIDGEKQTSVTIPSSVVSIGNYAFINCEDMISISIPSSVTSIGESAFEGCLGLTKAEFASIESLCNIKFDRMGASNPLSYAHHLIINGSEQTSVNIPSSVTNIGDYTFLGCSGLTSVTIPSSVTSIGIAAFAGCTGLTSITIPPSVNFINGAAFAGTGIASIVIPESVTDLVGELFANCHNLASVTLPSTMQGIGSGNFRDCPNLKLITIKATTPPTIYASGTEAFPNYDITLCVPYNCRYIYAQTSPWNNFWDIKELTCEHSFTSTDNHDGTHNNSCSICGTVETVAHVVVNGICVNCGAKPDTDITDIANTIYFDNCNAFCGEPFELPIKMKNDIAATGFQFDIILPEGITAVQDEDGFYDITLSTERTTSAKTNTFDSSLMSDGSIRVLAASTRNYAFSGNDGEVCKIKLNVSEDLPAGDYPVILKNIELTNAQGKTWNVERLKRTITVKDYQLGDANGDGRVSVGDFSAIANHILGSTPEGFNLGAADANQDNNISVGDLSTVATMILTEEAGGASMAKAKARRSAEVSDPNNYIYADPVVISEDGDATIVFNMKNEIAATGFQFNFTLPEGFTVTEDEDGFLDVFLSQRRTTSRKTNTFDCVKWSDGSYRVLAASTKNYEFTGNDGEVVTVHIKKNDDVESGNYALVLTDIELTNAQGATFRTSRSSYTITVPSNSNEVELVDGETYDNPTTATYDKVTFTKTFSTSQANKWNALYVPMSINVEEYAGELDFAELYAFCATVDTNHDGNVDADDENYLLVHPVKAGNIKPNVPYLVRPHEAKTYTINSADNVLYGATAGKVEFATALDKFTVTGLNEAFTVTAGDNNYYVSSTGSLDYRETGSTTVKANRWVMHRESKEYGSDSGSASQGKSYKIIAIGEDMGEATAIELIKMSNGIVLDNSDVYTVDGRKVNADHKLVNGIYIKGGKTFIVK